MLGTSGVITITGDRKLAKECLQKGPRIIDEQMAMAELDEYKKAVDSSDLLKSKRPIMVSAFQSAGETKPVLVRHEDPNAALPTSPPPLKTNRKASSSGSSVRTGTSSHGNLLTCRVCPGYRLSIDSMSIRR